jgi:hypothetical protein
LYWRFYWRSALLHWHPFCVAWLDVQPAHQQGLLFGNLVLAYPLAQPFVILPVCFVGQPFELLGD